MGEPLGPPCELQRWPERGAPGARSPPRSGPRGEHGVRVLSLSSIYFFYEYPPSLSTPDFYDPLGATLRGTPTPPHPHTHTLNKQDAASVYTVLHVVTPAMPTLTQSRAQPPPYAHQGATRPSLTHLWSHPAMPISQERMITLAKAGEALMRQLDAMRQTMETAREAAAEGDLTGVVNVLDTGIIQCHPQRSVMEPIVLELAHFKRTAERNTKHMLRMQNHRLRESYGLTEPPVPRQGVPAHTEPPKGRGFYDTTRQDDLFVPPPSVGRVATPQGPEFTRIAEPQAEPQTRRLNPRRTLDDFSLEDTPRYQPSPDGEPNLPPITREPTFSPIIPPPRQPPTLSALGVRGTGDRADVITSVPDDVNATPELGADPFASPPRGGAGE